MFCCSLVVVSILRMLYIEGTKVQAKSSMYQCVLCPPNLLLLAFNKFTTNSNCQCAAKESNRIPLTWKSHDLVTFLAHFHFRNVIFCITTFRNSSKKIKVDEGICLTKSFLPLFDWVH